MLGRASSTAISGEVCLIRLNVSTHESDGPFERYPWKYLDNSEIGLRDEVEKAVRTTLGSEFHLDALAMGPGSIEIFVLIGTAYYALSRYKSLVESIELLVSQLKTIVQRFFERMAPMHSIVRATWSPGRGLLAAARTRSSSRSHAALVTWYLVLSHAAMLGALLWLLLEP